MDNLEKSSDRIHSEKNDQIKRNRPKRLISIDALRGFDMFWIIGGASIFHALADFSGWSLFSWWSHELTHTAWNGFTFYDMIFPLFLFLAGTTVPFSFSKRMNRQNGKSDLYKHILSRVLILIVLGTIFNGLLDFHWSEMRYASVLARIGLGWGFAAIIYLNTSSWKTRMVWFWGLLIGYWVILLFVPVPEVGAYVLTKAGWLGGYIDRLILPGRLHNVVHDPEGFLSTIPAVSTGLLGIMIGQLLKYDDNSCTKTRKFWYMLAIGLASLVLALLWDLVFPINKNMWTSSFVLYAGAWSILLLAIFYYIIDIKQIRTWAFFFIVIGSNSIVAYMVLDGGLINFHSTANYLFGGFGNYFTAPANTLIMAIAYIIVGWCFLYFLYKKKFFLKV